MTNKPSIQQITTIIANGHAYDEHVLGNDPDPAQQKYKGQNQFRVPGLGPDLNINTKSDIANYMKGIFDKPGTIGFQHPDGRYIFYNRADNVVMVMNGKSDDMGTVFRPNAGKAYFEKELKNAQTQAAKTGAKVTYENTPEGIKSLTGRAERTFMHDTRAMRTIEQRSKDLGIDHTLGKTPPAPDSPSPAGGPSTTATTLTEADKKLADVIKNADNTEAFFDAKSGAKFFLSEDKKTMMLLDSSGGVQLFKDKADDAFTAMFKVVTDSNGGKMPDVVTGGMKALSENAREGGLAARFLGKYADDAAEMAKLVGKFSKILPALGAVAVAVETYQFFHKAGTAQRMGIISSEALNEYKVLCTGSGATGLGGFLTSTGGEVAAMAAFDLWAKKHNVPDYLRKELQPDGLVRMAKDAAEKYILPDPFTKAGAEFKPGSGNDAIISAGDTNRFKTPSNDDDFDLAPSNYETAVCYLPEIEMLVQQAEIMKKADRELSQPSPGTTDLSKITAQRTLAEDNFTNAIKELAGNGGLKEVIDFSDDAYRKAIAKPGAAEPSLEQSMTPGDNSRLVLVAAAQSSKPFSP